MNIKIHIYEVPSEHIWVADYNIDNAIQSSWFSEANAIHDDSTFNAFLSSIPEIIRRGIAEYSKVHQSKEHPCIEKLRGTTWKSVEDK